MYKIPIHVYLQNYLDAAVLELFNVVGLPYKCEHKTKAFLFTIATLASYHHIIREYMQFLTT